MPLQEEVSPDQDQVMPRLLPEGTVPLIAVEGTAEECGRQFAEYTLENHVGYRRHLDNAYLWFTDFSTRERKLFEQHAPHILDIYKGLTAAGGPPAAGVEKAEDDIWACTTFGLSGSVTLDGHPISGGTRDVHIAQVSKHVVLRMRIKDAPTILMHTYPANVLGQMGFWSTGMSLFTNALYSREPSREGLSAAQWGFMALASESGDQAVELARRYGIKGAGNCLISDPAGHSLSVEYNGGGIGVVPAKDGIATHGNHPEATETAPFQAEYLDKDYPDQTVRKDTRYRMHGLWDLFNAERGRLTAQKAIQILADHTLYPRGICAHMIRGNPLRGTTAAIVAEPARGKIHATRSNPCCNWPVTYTI